MRHLKEYGLNSALCLLIYVTYRISLITTYCKYGLVDIKYVLNVIQSMNVKHEYENNSSASNMSSIYLVFHSLYYYFTCISGKLLHFVWNILYVLNYFCLK